MLIPITCDSCSFSFQVSDEFAGKTGKCPNPGCGREYRVPECNANAVTATNQGDGSSGVEHRIERLFDLLRQPAHLPADKSAEALQPGTTLGEFTLIEPLASGGMGEVFLARQESLKRTVALKVCGPSVARDGRARTRFQSEGQVLAQLRHPNVVPVLMTGEDRGYVFLAMEFVPGPTLADVFHAVRAASSGTTASATVAELLGEPQSRPAERPWSPTHATLDRAYREWIVQTLLKVAEGLSAIHAAGIVHRDIKPENIVLDTRGEPKIVDFGLARAEIAPSVTNAGEFVGTPAYTSPEQARGESAEVSPASDVFSFGVMLFESLSMQRPFDGSGAIAVLNSILNDEPSLLRKVSKKTPWELEAIVDKCLRKSPAERYASAKPLSDDLRSYLELRPITAKRATTTRRLTRQIRRRPWVAAFLAVLIVAVTLGGVAGSNVREKQIANLLSERERRFKELVDKGDAELYRVLTGQHPTWNHKFLDGTRNKAIDSYTAALAIYPDAVWPLVQRGRLHASKDETLSLALADFLRAKDVEPKYRSVHQFLAIVHERLANEAEAKSVGEAADKLYPTAANDLYWLGNISHAHFREFDQAHSHFSQCLLLAPDHYWARLERASFGKFNHKSLDVDRATRIEELRLAKSQRPDSPFASEALVVLYVASNNPDAAFRELKEATDRFGLVGLHAHDLAVMHAERGEFDTAESLLRRVPDDDNGARTFELLGYVNFRAGRYSEAAKWYEMAIERGKTDSLVFRQLALCAEAAGDLAKAESLLKKAVDQYPTDPFPYKQLGAWYDEHGRAADAEQLFRQAIAAPLHSEKGGGSDDNTSTLALAYMELANVLERQQRFDERIPILQAGIVKLKAVHETKPRWLQSASQLETDIFDLKRLLGQAFILAGRRDDAMKLINAESEEYPLDLPKARMLCDILRRLGETDQALAVARSAEFAGQFKGTEDERLVTGAVVDGALLEMGAFAEVMDRTKSRRALGMLVVESEFRLLAAWSTDLQEAIGFLQAGIEKYPRSLELRGRLAHLLLDKKDVRGSDEAFRAAQQAFFDDALELQRPSFGPTFPVLNYSQGVETRRRLLFPTNFIADCFKFLYRTGKADEIPVLEKRFHDELTKVS